MPSIAGLLNTARSGMAAAQAQIAATSQNVTNAQTVGYSRQRVLVTAADPQVLPQGIFGTGVRVDGVQRMRDELMDTAFRRDSQSAAFTETRRDALQSVETVLGEPSETGLASSLDQLWSSWSDLSTNPDSNAARSVVRQRAVQVGAQLNQYGNQINDAASVARTRLIESADRVNLLSAQVADLNNRIVAAEASGQQSPDMRDQRDLKADDLAKLIGGAAYRQANGSVNITVGGDSIVDGANFKTVRVQALKTDPTKLGIALGTAPAGGVLTETMYQIGGEAAGFIDAYNNLYPDAIRKLDGIASALVTKTNSLHQTGFIGATAAGNFFAPAGTTARTIKVDASILADSSRIAASGIANESGDNSVALAMSQLRQTTVAVNGQTASISEGYRTVVANLATTVNGANGTAAAARTLTTLSDARRDSVKGVSIDEEMVNLMKFQQAYAAAAKMISVVDEMSQTLINLGR